MIFLPSPSSTSGKSQGIPLSLNGHLDTLHHRVGGEHKIGGNKIYKWSGQTRICLKIWPLSTIIFTIINCNNRLFQSYSLTPFFSSYIDNVALFCNQTCERRGELIKIFFFLIFNFLSIIAKYYTLFHKYIFNNIMNNYS